MKLQTRINVIFSGRVQGVGFRLTSAEIAGRYPITGWVRNLSDGTVELEAQGPTRAIDGFLREVADTFEGYIDNAIRSELDIRTDEARFEIRR